MKRKTKTILSNSKAVAACALSAAFAFLALPLGTMRSNRANAEVETAAAEAVGGSVIASAGGVDVDVTVNYYRKDEAYTDWNVWIWEDGGNGANYTNGTNGRLDFDEQTISFDSYPDKNWKTLTVTVHNVNLALAEPIGVIVRKGNWEKQSADLMVSGDKIVNNELSVYVVGDDSSASLFYTVEDAMSNKVSQAYFNAMNRVHIETTAAISASSVFKIKDEEGAVVGTLDCSQDSAYVGQTAANITLDGNIVLNKKYTVVDEPAGEFNGDVNFVGMDITFSKLFDMEAFSVYEYDGTLGAEYSQSQTKFTVWSPYATAMRLNIYDAGEGGTATTYEMTAGSNGTWTYTLPGDQNGKYYTYSVVTGATSKEIVDPYARSAGRNGKRGMILDLASTNPEGWENHSRPAARGSYSNAVIYEAHIRDLTMHESSNVSAEHRGKFLGLTESASDANGNLTTPLDYIKSLGVTELHILPMFDINSVDEYTGNATYNKAGEYNWGYDPLNYNVPEGSYSTDPTDGAVRVRELKEMIMALHEAGIRVIMDVVYNHVADVNGSNFQALMPNYYFRTNADGSFANGSGCGNDTASERTMYHKFMVESVNYWADEYKIDGFRFDLMGLHDTKTMNEIYDTLAEKNPDVMVYGEGWEMGTMVETADKKKADMFHAEYMPNIAFFNDVTRDALKGGGFGQDISSKGYIEGSKKDPAIYIGAVGGTNIRAAGYTTLGKSAFASNPTQNVNYVSCHDNSALWDKINASATETDAATLKAMNRLGAAAVLTSQGATFFLAGEEMLRTKPVSKDNLTYNEESKVYEDKVYDSRPEKWLNEDYYFADNSYKSPDSVNAIDWTLAETNADMVEFYKQLILLRKNTPQFHIDTKAELEQCLKIVDAKMTDGITSYAVKDPNSDEYVVVLFNNTNAAVDVAVPDGNYSVYVNGDRANGAEPLSTFSGDSFTVGAYSAVVMKANLTTDKLTEWEEVVKPSTPTTPDTPAPDNTGNGSTGGGKSDSNLGLALGLGIGIPAAVLIAGGVVFGVMLSKKKKGKGDAEPTQSVEAGDVPESETTADEAPQDSADQNADNADNNQ